MGGGFGLSKMNSNSILHPTVKIFHEGEVRNSIIGEDSFVGEHSRVRNCEIAHHVKIDRNNLLQNVRMGKCSYTGPFDMIFNSEIGAYTSISYGCTIGPPEHNYTRPSTHPFIYDEYYGIFEKKQLLHNDKFDKSLRIGNDVWIGCNSTILRGVAIADGAIVGANSLVKHDVPAYAIVVGNPAKIIKYRFSTDIIKLLQEIKWWEWPQDMIRQYADFFTSELTMDKLLLIKKTL